MSRLLVVSDDIFFTIFLTPSFLLYILYIPPLNFVDKSCIFSRIFSVFCICAKGKKFCLLRFYGHFLPFPSSQTTLFSQTKGVSPPNRLVQKEYAFEAFHKQIFLIYGTKSFRLPYAAFFFVKIARTGNPISTRMIPPTATFLASGPAMNSWFSRTYRPEMIAMIGITGYAGTL